MNITCRQAIQSDIDALLAIEKDCFTTDQLSRNSFKRFINSPSAMILVATHKKDIIGYILILLRKGSTRGRIYSLAVLQNYRQKNIAGKLLDLAEVEVKKQGITILILEVHVKNISAIHFYEKHGFELFGLYNNFYEDGSDALRMKKTIPL